MTAIGVWPRRIKEFLLAHPLFKSPTTVCAGICKSRGAAEGKAEPMMRRRLAMKKIRQPYENSLGIHDRRENWMRH